MNNKRKLSLAFITIVIIILLGTVSMLQTINTMNQTKPIKVAAVGDSITSGFGYPENLQKLLGVNYQVSNFGLGGTTVTLDGETPYMRDPIFSEAKASQPDIVIIMLGTNDAHPGLHQFSGSFVNDYTTLLNEFQELASKPHIWVVKPPPIFNNGTGLSTEFLSQTIIPSIEEVAAKTNLPIIDLFSSLLDRSDCFYDGVHPNSKGTMLIANEIYGAINSK